MFLPEFDRDYLTEKGYTFEEKVESNQNYLIIRNWSLPKDQYNVEQSDLLILIPGGYPDVKPDMWYFCPAILLKPENRYANATNYMQTILGEKWQRWSRHSNDWRSGIDGMRTYLQRVQTALEVAR